MGSPTSSLPSPLHPIVSPFFSSIQPSFTVPFIYHLSSFHLTARQSSFYLTILLSSFHPTIIHFSFYLTILLSSFHSNIFRSTFHLSSLLSSFHLTIRHYPTCGRRQYGVYIMFQLANHQYSLSNIICLNIYGKRCLIK